MIQPLESNRAIAKIFLLSLLIFIVCQAKVLTNTFNAGDIQRNKGWIYLGRTTFEPDSTLISLQLKLKLKKYLAQLPIDFEILAIPAQFLNQQLGLKCDFSKYEQEILKRRSGKQISFRAQFNQSNLVYNAKKNIQVKEQLTYNFILKDCMKNLINPQLIVLSSLDIRLEIKSNQRNYVSNQFHNIWTLPLFIVLSYGILNILSKDGKNSSWIKLILQASMWAGIGSLIFKFIDHFLYSYFSGQHNNFLDAFYLVGQSISDTTLMILILFVAFGWSVTFQYHIDFDVFLPSSLFISFSYMANIILNKSRDNWYNRFHVYDTFAGYIMVAFRVLFLIIFAYGIKRSYKQLTQKDIKLKKFFKEFAVFGTVYFSSFPLCMIIAEVFTQENRYQCMTIVLETARLLLNILFTIMIGWRNSSYRQAISQGQVDKNKKTN